MAIMIESVVVRSPDQAFAPVQDDLVLLHVESGKYFWANPVGAEVWARIEQPTRVRDLCNDLELRFDVSTERCRDDVTGFLAALEDRGLIHVVD